MLALYTVYSCTFNCILGINSYYYNPQQSIYLNLYHGLWEVAIATFVIQSEIYAHNMCLDSLKLLLLDNHEFNYIFVCYHRYCPAWRKLWAYNARAIYAHNFLQTGQYPIHIPTFDNSIKSVVIKWWVPALIII